MDAIVYRKRWVAFFVCRSATHNTISTCDNEIVYTVYQINLGIKSNVMIDQLKSIQFCHCAPEMHMYSGLLAGDGHPLFFLSVNI